MPLSFFAPLVLVLPIDASLEWPAFRGPNGSGICASAEIPEALDTDKNLSWQIPVPPGYSSPVVDGDSLYLTAYEGRRLSTFGFDRRNGALRWRTDAPEPLPSDYRGANSPVSSSPVTDGERVYVFFETSGMLCYDREGKEVWRHSMGPFNCPHGLSTSPVIDGEVLLFQCDQDTDSFLLALDRKSGKEIWKAARPRITHGYSTPVVYHPTKGPAQVITSGSYELRAYALDSGRELWTLDGMSWQAKSVPVIDGDRLYVHSFMGAPSEYGAPTMSGAFEDVLKERDKDEDGKISLEEWPDKALRELWFLYDLDNDELLGPDEWSFAVARYTSPGGLFCIGLETGKGSLVWSSTDKRGLPNIPSPLLHDGVLYLLKEGGLLTGFDAANGNVLEQSRVGEPDTYYASPVSAGDRILLASHSGQLTVVKTGKDFEVLSTNDLGEQIWSTPAVANGQIFVRTQEQLYCFRSK